MATPTGERSIGSLRVGETVEAYNAATGQAEAEPIQHVWVNHDSDLVDVRVSANSTTTATPPASGAVQTQASGHGWLAAGDGTSDAVHLSVQRATTSTTGETIHTTANHPWLTADHGFVPAGDLRPGKALVTLNGGSDIVVWVRVMPGG